MSQPQSAAEHFAWAKERAMEYVEQGEGAMALRSLISDLNKHPGTAGLMTPALQSLAMGEFLVAGVRGVGRFIEGIAAPPIGCWRCGRTGTPRNVLDDGREECDNDNELECVTNQFADRIERFKQGGGL